MGIFDRLFGGHHGGGYSGGGHHGGGGGYGSGGPPAGGWGNGGLACPNCKASKATLNKPSKISAQTWMTQFFGLLCLSRGPFGQFAGR